MANIRYTVFTKPWKDVPLAELGRKVKCLGFDGVELPVRPGFQVEPANVAKGLPEAAKILGDCGVKVGDVAGPIDEATIEACGAAGVPIIRTMASIDLKLGFRGSIDRLRRQYDAAVPALERCGVAIGVQNHCGRFVGSAAGLLYLLEKYDPRHVCAVLDMAHCGLDGEPEELAVDTIWPHMGPLVNFKSATWRKIGANDAGEDRHAVYWTTWREALYSWSKMAGLLKQRGFTGDVCICGEYSSAPGEKDLQGDDVIPQLKEDLAHIRPLLDGY